MEHRKVTIRGEGQVTDGGDDAKFIGSVHKSYGNGDKPAYHTAQISEDYLLPLDQYFLAVPALQTLGTLNRYGIVCLEIVTKTKKSCTAFERPAPRKPGRGLSPKKGPPKHPKSSSGSRNAHGSVCSVGKCLQTSFITKEHIP